MSKGNATWTLQGSLKVEKWLLLRVQVVPGSKTSCYGSFISHWDIVEIAEPLTAPEGRGGNVTLLQRLAKISSTKITLKP